MKTVRSTFFLMVMFAFSITDLTAQKTFTNPLLPAGADPWCIYHKGKYYYTHTTGRNVTLFKTKNIAKLKDAKRKVVFQPPERGPYSKEIWAPEIHRLNNKWYIYFAADSGRNVDHRLFVLENSHRNPLRGEWIMKGKLETPEDKWSIDGTVYEHNGKMFLLWSGWEGDHNGRQDIFIAEMSNPWTVTGKRVRLSSPRLEWETVGDLNNPNDVPHVDVNEGPQVLKNAGKLFLIYSASGCWTDNYALGMLSTSVDSNIMDSTAWTKHPEPVFKQNVENGVYAPGHNSFFTSPDGNQNWILYHANDKPGQGCGRFRSPRAQQFFWNADGSPNFGKPVSTSTVLELPGRE